MSARAQKLGILVSVEQSMWKSCNSISPNLIRSYELLARDRRFHAEWFRICPKSEATDLRVGTGYILELAQKIMRSGISDLIFLDHHIDPVPLLIALRMVNHKLFKALRFSFHLYGDFTLAPERWMDVGKQLSGLQVKFICASERQRRLVAFFEPHDKSVSTVCPFPVNTRRFSFSEKFRSEIRRKLGIKDSQTLLLYTGRISMQKCVLRLIDEFARLMSEGRKDICLAIAGPIDDLAGLTSGIQIPRGFFFHRLEDHLHGLPARVREKIFVLGDLDGEELRKVYSAGDLFVSLSLHHDEDFGMCPAEALSSGLPSILTDWGGYASFRGAGIPCQLVPVHLGKRGLDIDAGELAAKLKNGLEQARPAKRPTARERIQAGLKFEKGFGIAAVANELKTQLAADSFKASAGFYWSLEMVRHAGGNMTGDLYKDVYERYVQPRAH